MPYNKPWSEAELAQAKIIVSSHTSMEQACAEMSRTFNRGVGVSNFRDTCSRRGLGNPRDWLQTPAVVATDPVERKQLEDKQARTVREHKSLTDEVARLRAIVEYRDTIAHAPMKPIVRREFKSGLREATAVALASDWHVEERVKPTDTPTGNAYNLAIASLRIDRFFQGIVWMVQHHRSAFQIRDMQLWLGGDLVTGHIHDENVETSAFPPVKAILWLQPQLESGIRFLRDTLELDRLQVVCSYGNHGRDTKKPRRATGAHHSYEWGMYQQLAMNFANDDRVEFHAPPSGHQYTDIYDLTAHYHHGDEISYGGGVGGITIPINKAVAQWDQARRSDLHNFGHFHQYMNGNRVANNGSLIGYNAYAMSIKATPERPQQAFYLVDSKHGKTCCSPLWVGDERAEAKLWKEAA